MLRSFKIDNIVSSVMFSVSISVLLFALGIVGINRGCSVMKTL